MILCTGLTPAWQHVLRFETLTPGEVNRAAEVHWFASGKVFNAAVALRHLGAPCRALSVRGGRHGIAMHDDLERLGVAARFVEVATATRVCTTLVDAEHHQATELVENAGPVTPAELDLFRQFYVEEAAAAAVVILIGSLPAGTPAEFYRDLLSQTPGRAVVDARGPELLHALTARPFLVKPNREELRRTLGRELYSEDELLVGMRELCRRGAEWVVVSGGAEPLYVVTRSAAYRVVPPRREVVNAIGSGDCMSAGLAWGLDRGLDVPAALRLGVAAAAENVSQLLIGRLDRARVEDVAAGVEVVSVAPAAIE